jgi:hypothetical protein
MPTTTYPVTWQERGAAPLEGRLELGAETIAFEGLDERDRPVWRTIALDELRALRLFLDDDPGAGRALLVETTNGQVVIHSAARHAQVLEELAERIADRELVRERRTVLVLPLREGSDSRAHEIAAEGPPFDPAELPLESHELLLTSGEAIFVFESTSCVALESILDAFDIWSAAATWSDLIAGPPQVAYSWHRDPSLDGIGLGL